MPPWKSSARVQRLTQAWARIWMRYAGLTGFGRLATRMAVLFAKPHKARKYLARMTPKGFVSPSAIIYHSDLRLGAHVFMDDRVVVFQRHGGEYVEIGDGVHIYRDVIVETGYGGSVSIGEESGIHPRCQINANVCEIRIGRGVMLAPNCALYSYDHGTRPDQPIRSQPLESKGPIMIGDEAWLGVGTIVLSGVTIGRGAVIGAGSLVTSDIPEGAMAAGVPARVIKRRGERVRSGEPRFEKEVSSL